MVKRHQELLRYAVALPPEHTEQLVGGASVAIDGVCQTVVALDQDGVWFEAIPETLRCTTLSQLAVGQAVHVERSLRYGEEVGGHLLSGHVCGTGEVVVMEYEGEHGRMALRLDAAWKDYLFPKGYIALDGVSLTVGRLSATEVEVYLIPETWKRTHLGRKEVGGRVNVEIDAQTRAVVDTVKRVLADRFPQGEGKL